MINVAGNKIYPKKLERIIKTHENVLDVNIFSEDSIIQGHIAGATIKLINTSKKAQEEFKLWCSKNINITLLPKIWKFE
jgi:acyl-CoA synthetase (AMP-forming)/AMP-acid ligase II